MFDPSSPTCLRKRKNNQPAGIKHYKPGSYSAYNWELVGYDREGAVKQVRWPLMRSLYEYYYNVDLDPKVIVVPYDGDKDNFKIENLKLATRDHLLLHRINLKAWQQFKNVKLDYLNPDYFLHPCEWKHPVSLEALSIEIRLREKGESLPPVRSGSKKEVK